MRVRKLEGGGRNNSKFFRSIFPKTDFLRSATFTFFSRVADWANALAVSACLAFNGCGEPEQQKRDYEIYFKKPEKHVKYDTTGKGDILVGERQILLTYKRDATGEQKQNVQNWLNNIGAKQVGYVSGAKTYQYELKQGVNLKDTITSLKKMSGVWIVVPNYKLTQFLDPKPNIKGNIYNGHWWMDTIKARQAWSITTGSEKIPIAIIDRGFVKTTSDHFDSKALSYGVTCVYENAEQGTHFKFYKPEHKPKDCMEIPSEGSHGTSVAAIAGARGDENKAGAGVAWKNPLISIDLGSLDGIEIPGAIELAIKMGAKVINISVGLQGSASAHEKFREHVLPGIENAYKNGVLVVFAAGNDGVKNDDNWLPSNVDQSEMKYFKSNTLFVGGVDDLNNPACDEDYHDAISASCKLIRMSNACKCPSCDPFNTKSQHLTAEGKVVELSAPGYRIAVPNSSKLDGSFKILKGTSFSAPMVAGAAGLVFGINSNLTPEKAKNILLATAQKGLSKCHDIGGGILDVEAALKMAKTYKVTTPGQQTTWCKSVSSALSAIQTKDGNYIILSSGSNVSKLDTSGNQLWNYSHSTKSTAFSIEQTTDLGFIIGSNIGLIKLNQYGKLQWTNDPDKLASTLYRSYPTYKASQTTDKGYIVALGMNTLYYPSILKTDSKGNKQWTNLKMTFAGEEPLVVNTIKQIADSRYILAGRKHKTDSYAHWHEAWLAQTDSTGNTKWENTFGKKGFNNEAYTLAISPNSYVIAGDGSSVGIPLVVRTNMVGKEMWRSTVTVNNFSDASSVYPTSDGGVVVGGNYRLNVADTASYGWIFKVDSTSGLEWKKTFDNTSTCSAKPVTSAIQTTDGGYLIVGQDVVMKTDKNGEVK